ncbi:MAG TPA: HAD family hydrolase [Leptolyngbya sp.]|jgi:phosphoglycolate phosphatase-like HAD superfamily hydrolase|nr:HAD family hydrolase [Leptolyngbya sp.]
MSTPRVLALDFDGVICNGLKEYFQTAWQAYAQIWQADATPDESFAPAFYRLRPVVETGWEMPVLIRALVLGIEEEKILQNWVSIASQIIIDEDLKPLSISAILDGIRDDQIATNLQNWLAEHEFYPGVLDRLKTLLNSPTDLFIISTKEGRFIKQLLHQQGIEIKDQQIYGKEAKRPKHQILLELQQAYGDVPIWFVEDRLQTLRLVEQREGLEKIGLFLADWGYNTASERQEAEKSDRVALLSIERFTQDLATWRPA